MQGMYIRVEVCRYVQAVNVHVQYVMLYDMIVVGVTMSDTTHVTVYVYRCYCDVKYVQGCLFVYSAAVASVPGTRAHK